MMQKPVLEKPSAILGELENSCLLCQWLRGVNAPGSEPQQRGYRIFIHGQAWLSWFAGLWGLGDCKEQDKAEWDKLQFLVLWVPTFWDWSDPDFARSKLSYRGRRTRRLCKILTFPLHPPILTNAPTHMKPLSLNQPITTSIAHYSLCIKTL